MCLTTKEKQPVKVESPVKCYKIVNIMHADGQAKLMSFYFGHLYQMGVGYFDGLFHVSFNLKQRGDVSDVSYGYHSYKSEKFAEDIMEFYRYTYPYERLALLECEIQEGSMLYTGLDGFHTRSKGTDLDPTCYCSDCIKPIRWRAYGETEWRNYSN